MPQVSSEQQSNFAQKQQMTSITNLGEVASISFCPTNYIHYYKNPIILNKQYTQDILPGVYEGGFQLWQCEVQFLKKIFELEIFTHLFIGKSVIEIGCGHGLLAVAAAKRGATQITLQDYNQNVIQQLTQPTIALNKVSCQTNFIWGDWDQILTHNGYDIILGSEITYREENYEKILNFILKNMKSTGKCILANKSYYFGVGGNLVGFKQKVQEKGLQWRSLCKMIPKSGGNKKEIIEITFK